MKILFQFLLFTGTGVRVLPLVWLDEVKYISWLCSVVKSLKATCDMSSSCTCYSTRPSCLGLLLFFSPLPLVVLYWTLMASNKDNHTGHFLSIVQPSSIIYNGVFVVWLSWIRYKYYLDWSVVYPGSWAKAIYYTLFIAEEQRLPFEIHLGRKKSNGVAMN